MKYNIGDIVEFIPANCPSDWWQGTGLILANDDGQYTIEFFELSKTFRKNLSMIQYGHTRYSFSIEFADKYEIFKILA